MPHDPPGPAPHAPPRRTGAHAAADTPHPDAEPRGCLFALSQPPLMLFLAVIGVLLLITAVHDLFLL
ncbi:hypothetical protein V1J52_13050 [Streptomyces sp. TRM 70351]|uniref:hypothetical protein n=1 Tax=Streptomyces sp. TRM 70351 TaxID=3116552 RepID=UPI002E7BDBA3|nr:hypothetical protein [Streptomyces sp. TRM 70351]MEE1929095.1 hypothetical protein [Streptomyces sp. TRM 70351]